jgi:hypothetical protein
VIQGLKLDVPAAELSEKLLQLIHSQESRVSACELRMQRADAIEQSIDGASRILDELGWKGGFDSLRKQLARKRSRHLRSRAWLAFIRNHLVQGEVYRLGERDMWFIALLA